MSRKKPTKYEKYVRRLAKKEYDNWVHWQRHVHLLCVKNLDGSLTIPQIYVKRWDKYINTHYNDLSKMDQASYVDEVLMNRPLAELLELLKIKSNSDKVGVLECE